MKISLDWLEDYVDISLPLPRLIEKLNMIGLMVEGWEEKGQDIILEIETYANRPDTLGHIGIARELATGLGLTLKEKKYSLAEIDHKTSDLIDVQIWHEDLCPRYCGTVVKDIQVRPSPEWLRKRIEVMGLKPINNVVDITNYVLFATAHPIHAFDLDKISGRKIIVRRARKREFFKSLEGVELHLSQEMLVIADEKKPVALAGIIGGEESAVSEKTRDVFIESAYFDPVSVRKTSKEKGLQTDASYRFERGADIAFAPHAAQLAASLLSQLGGKVTRGTIDVYPKPRKNKEIILRHRRIFDLLGVLINEDFVRETLGRLGFQVGIHSRGVWRVRVPFFRVDIEREADLIEEIARFYGYDKIPAVVPPVKIVESGSDKNRERIQKARQLLFHHGFDEVLNFSFSDPEKEEKFGTDRRAIEIRNPVSLKASLLRTTLLGGLLETTCWNTNRGIEGIHIFEIGNIYFWDRNKDVEQLFLGLLTTGPIGTPYWRGKNEETDFFHLKGTCEALMAHLRYEPFSFEEEEHSYFEEGNSLALIYKGEKIGYVGLLKRRILDSYSLNQAVYAAELNLEALFGKQQRSFQYVPVIRFPSVSRDLSFIVDRNISYQDIEKAVEKLALPYLEEFDLVDYFSGPSIPKDKISLSVHFIYRHPKRTLLAEEVDKFQQKIISHLKSAFNIQLREGGKIDKRIGKN